MHPPVGRSLAALVVPQYRPEEVPLTFARDSGRDSFGDCRVPAGADGDRWWETGGALALGEAEAVPAAGAHHEQTVGAVREPERRDA